MGRRLLASLLATAIVAVTFASGGPESTSSAATSATAAAVRISSPKVGHAVAFDKTLPLRQMRQIRPRIAGPPVNVGERGGDGAAVSRAFKGDGALQVQQVTSSMPAPMVSFDGPNNTDNFNIFGFRVNPPDPVGDVGMNHYVAMVNLVFAVYSKTGQLLYGPAAIGTLWQGFAVEDCTDPSGDPIVLYDEISNRWVLTQFTTRFATNQFYNCVAISVTQDPLGPYYRYAFSTGANFPDYPKYGIMPESLTITTREFAPDDTESIGIYAINRHKLIKGDPNPEIVAFQLTAPAYLVGDGLLPPDLDGNRLPPPHSPIVLIGSMDDDAFDGAPFDALNVFHLRPDWVNPAESTFAFIKHVPVAEFDSIYPCAPTSRDCLPQPGIVNPAQYLDILSYRQRPTWRLQYRNFRTHETLVTNQSVEAMPGVAGIRWWELRNPLDPVLYQEGTWAPNDGVHRWMGSAAMDNVGNLAVGYSVVNGVDVFPGIRYAGRRAGDPLGQLAQGEAVLINGSGVQTTTNSRWGDYTSLNIDPKDDCTFWYVNEYYTAASQATSLAGWLTRIGTFKFPGCR